MGRNPSPIPGIVHLKLLVSLYLKHKRIPFNKNTVQEKDVQKQLAFFLKKDEITKENSTNLFDKLLGNPYNKDFNTVEGIAISVLNKISQKVINAYPLSLNSQNLEIGFAWNTFYESIKLPQHLISLNSKKYYKYLSEEEKKMVDLFIDRELNELIPTEHDSHFFVAYYWHESDKKISCSTIQIYKNPEHVAIVKYHHLKNDMLYTHIVQRSDIDGGFIKFERNILYISLVDEDNSRAFRTFINLRIHSSSLNNINILEGTYCSSILGATTPTSGKVVIQRVNTYQKALDIVVGKEKVDNSITFELLQSRQSSTVNEIKNIKDFPTSKLYELIKKVKGGYTFGYIPSHNNLDKKIIAKGYCFISETGIVQFKLNNRNEYTGYIETDRYYSNSSFSMSIFFESSVDDFKFNFILEIVTLKNNGSVLQLKGIYSGIDKLKPNAGQVIFIKQEGIKDYTEFTISSKIDINDFNSDSTKLSKENKEILKFINGNEFLVVPKSK